MKDSTKIKETLQKWIDENRENLPLNIDLWNIDIHENIPNEAPQKMLSFGSYNAKGVTTASFHKPHSRIVKL